MKTKRFDYVKVGNIQTPSYQRSILKTHPIFKGDISFNEDKAGVAYLFHHTSDDTFWVGDGLQRTSKALSEFGSDYLFPSFIYEDFSPDEEIDLFVSWNSDRKALAAVKIFLLKAENGDEDSADILSIVHDEGFDIQEGGKGKMTFKGAGGLQVVYGWHTKVKKPDVLRTSLKIMKDAYGDSGDAVNNGLLRGVGYLVNKYNHSPGKISTLLAQLGTANAVLFQVPGLISGSQEARVGEYLNTMLSGAEKA